MAFEKLKEFGTKTNDRVVEWWRKEADQDFILFMSGVALGAGAAFLGFHIGGKIVKSIPTVVNPLFLEADFRKDFPGRNVVKTFIDMSPQADGKIIPTLCMEHLPSSMILYQQLNPEMMDSYAKMFRAAGEAFSEVIK